MGTFSASIKVGIHFSGDGILSGRVIFLSSPGLQILADLQHFQQMLSIIAEICPITNIFPTLISLKRSILHICCHEPLESG